MQIILNKTSPSAQFYRPMSDLAQSLAAQPAPAPTRRSLLACCAALALPGCSALPAQPTLEAAPPVALPGTRQIDLAAGPDGPLHRIMLAVPPGPPPAGGYPVLYVLDGNLLFATAAQLVRNRFARGPSVPAQGPVVVGLGYAGEQVLDLEARSRDYTPPAPGPQTDERGRPEGGADAFLDFVECTVRPLVARHLPLNASQQTLFGHSYGGLCVLHALFTRPGGFQNYVAASPSLWWRDGFVLQEMAQFLATRSAAGSAAAAQLTHVLVTQGEREALVPAAVSADPARAAIARERRSNDRIDALLSGLRGAPGVDLRFVRFPDADHASAMLPALQQAIALSLQHSQT